MKATILVPAVLRGAEASGVARDRSAYILLVRIEPYYGTVIQKPAKAFGASC